MDENRSQFDKADSAVARVVDAFMTRIELMFWKLEPVYATYILERAADTVSPDDQAAR